MSATRVTATVHGPPRRAWRASTTGCQRHIVPFAAAELIGDAPKLFHLAGCQQPAGDLGSHHLDAHLPLSINPVFEPERTEVVFRNFARNQRISPLKGYTFLVGE